MKKILAVLLCCVLLVSCSAGVDAPDTSGDISADVSGEASAPAEESEQYTDPLALLPDEDFGGEKITIWTTDGAVADPESAYDTAIQKAMQERIDAIETKFNIEIVVEIKTADEINTGLRGETLPHMVLMGSVESGSNSANNKYVNLWTLPYFKQAAEKLDGIAEEQTINNSLFMLTTPTLFSHQNAMVIYCNRDLLAEKGLRTPAYDVVEGNWTVAKMLEYMNAVSTSAGKPTPDISNDIFGFTSVGLNTSDLINVIWNGSGIKYFGDTYKKPLYAEFDYEQGKLATQAVNTLFDSGNRLTDTDAIDTESVFLSGRSLFCITRFDRFTGNNRISDFDWEVLPMPKISGEQQGYSSPVNSAVCLSVPAGISDTYKSGLLVSAWLLASNKMDETLNRYYITYTSTDNVNTVMMDEVFKSATYPVTELYSGVYNINSVGKGLIATSVTDNINLEVYIRWQDWQMEQTAEKFK